MKWISLEWPEPNYRWGEHDRTFAERWLNWNELNFRWIFAELNWKLIGLKKYHTATPGNRDLLSDR